MEFKISCKRGSFKRKLKFGFYIYKLNTFYIIPPSLQPFFDELKSNKYDEDKKKILKESKWDNEVK